MASTQKFYYVKNGGTKTSGYLTAPITNFSTASEFYPTLLTAANQASVAEALICVSHLHVETGVVSTINLDVTSDVGMGMVSVDDANPANYKKGASITFTGGSGNYFVFTAEIHIRGMIITSGRYFWVSSGGNVWFDDCDLSNDYRYFADGTNTGSSIRFTNCNLNRIGETNVAYAWFYGEGGIKFIVDNCVLTDTAGPSNLMRNTSNNQGCSLHISNSDLTGLNLPADVLVQSNGASNYASNIYITNCKLAATTNLYLNNWVNLTAVYRVTGSAATYAEAQDQYMHMGTNLEVFEDTSFVRTQSPTRASGNKVSYKIRKPKFSYGVGTYGYVDMPAQYMALDRTGNQVLTFYIASEVVINLDFELWFSASYISRDNPTQTVTSTSRRQEITLFDPTPTIGQIPTDSTSTWESAPAVPSTYFHYKVELPLYEKPGAAGMVNIRFYLNNYYQKIIYLDSDIGRS